MVWLDFTHLQSNVPGFVGSASYGAREMNGDPGLYDGSRVKALSALSAKACARLRSRALMHRN